MLHKIVNQYLANKTISSVPSIRSSKFFIIDTMFETYPRYICNQNRKDFRKTSMHNLIRYCNQNLLLP